MPFFVKFAVVGQVGLGGQTQDSASIDDYSTIEQFRVEPQGGADQQHRRECFAFLDQARHRGFAGIKQRVLVEKVFVRIG